jgi:autotransporter-associated beta strand protein
VAITLDTPVTLGALQFGGSSTGYSLGGNNLTFNNIGGAAAVTLFSGIHRIAAAVQISGGNLDIAASGSSVLAISGNISDDGGQRSLTLSGDGTGQLVLSGSNTYSGGTFVDAGTLILDSAASLADGSSLTVGNPTAFGAAVQPAAGPPLASLAVVPEPGTLALLAAGIAVAIGIRWRRKTQSAASTELSYRSVTERFLEIKDTFV